MAKFYKGDIIQREVRDSDKLHITSLWGADLIGVNQDTIEMDSYVLFYRPLKNKLKHFFRKRNETKYNLTFWQRLELKPLWVYWFLSVSDDKKSWHLVKKGMEKHEHKYTIPFKKRGYSFMACEHEGCTMCNPIN